MNDRPGSDMVRPSPPADFPVYGLAASWSGSQWLESFGDAIGDPVRWVSLGHQSLNGESLTFVETFSRLRADALAARFLQPPLQQVAFYAAVVLINVTLPAKPLPWPDGFQRALVGHADERSGQYAQWPLVSWRVNGAAVTARAWWFAGGWVGRRHRRRGERVSGCGGCGHRSGRPVARGASRRQRLPFRLGAAAAHAGDVGIQSR